MSKINIPKSEKNIKIKLQYRRLDYETQNKTHQDLALFLSFTKKTIRTLEDINERKNPIFLIGVSSNCISTILCPLGRSKEKSPRLVL